MSRIAGVVWGNIGMLVAFAGFLVAAVLNRRKSEIHKRLMYLASIAIILPAFGRIAKFPMIDLPEPPVAFAGLLIESDHVSACSRHQIMYEEHSGLMATLPVDLPETSLPAAKQDPLTCSQNTTGTNAG